MSTGTSRNAPCPCGSGKKYKLCCMVKEETQASQFAPIVSRPVEYYRTSLEFVETIARAEIGVHEAFYLTERELMDEQVRKEVNHLIRELQTQGLQPTATDNAATDSDRHPVSCVSWCIRRHWQLLFEDSEPHGAEDLQGCLRSILKSIKVWSTPDRRSQGYLYFLHGMMQTMGVNVERVALSGEPFDPEERPEDPLIELAEAWLKEGMPRYVSPFHREADKLLDRRKPSPVIHVCQYLIGRTNEQRTSDSLRPLLSRAYGQLGQSFG